MGPEPAVGEHSHHPARTGDHLPQKRNAGGAASQQLLDAVAEIALAQSWNARIDRHDQRREPRLLGAVQHVYRRFAAAAQIYLVPRGTVGRGANLLHRRPRQGREDVAGTGLSGRSRRQHFAVRIEHAAAAHGCEDERQFERHAEHAGLQIDGGYRDRAARAERNLLERPDVIAQRDFGIGAAVDVIEHHPGQPALRQPAQITDIEYMWGTNAPWHWERFYPTTIHRTADWRLKRRR
jgi:hypothetical protein